jgi:hypothetical protein
MQATSKSLLSGGRWFRRPSPFSRLLLNGVVPGRRSDDRQRGERAVSAQMFLVIPAVSLSHGLGSRRVALRP